MTQPGTKCLLFTLVVLAQGPQRWVGAGGGGHRVFGVEPQLLHAADVQPGGFVAGTDPAADVDTPLAWFLLAGGAGVV